MIHRIFSVARVTFLESLRSKSLVAVFVIILIQLLVGSLMGDVSPLSRARSLQTTTLLSFNIFFLLAVLTLAGGTIPQDLKNRHLYFIFVKPLRKWEFLLGKILGIWGTLLLGAAIVALSLVTCLFLFSDAEARVVHDRARTQKISSEVEGTLKGDALHLKFQRNARGVWRLPSEVKHAHSLEWPDPKSKDEKPFYGLLSHGQDSERFKLVSEEGKFHLDLPEKFRREGTEISLSRDRLRPDQIIRASLKPGRKAFWQSTSVDADFSYHGATLFLDFRRSFPGQWFDLEISAGSASHRQRFAAGTLYSIPMDSLKPQNADHLKLEVALHASRRGAAFTFGSNRLWVEGRKHAMEANVFKGMGIAAIYLMLTAALTLISSLFLTQPTAMLLGFTLFVVSQNVSHLYNFPTAIFSEKSHVVHMDHHHTEVGHAHGTEEAQEVVEQIIERLIWLFPNFEKDSPFFYFNRGDKIPLRLFWEKVSSMVSFLFFSLVLGSFAVSRKEFLN